MKENANERLLKAIFEETEEEKAFNNGVKEAWEAANTIVKWCLNVIEDATRDQVKCFLTGWFEKEPLEGVALVQEMENPVQNNDHESHCDCATCTDDRVCPVEDLKEDDEAVSVLVVQEKDIEDDGIFRVALPRKVKSIEVTRYES